MLFDREHLAMRLHFQLKSKKDKSKKLKAKNKLFEEVVDEDLRNLLLEEYFDMCRKFCRVQLIIWSITRNIVKEKRAVFMEGADEYC